MITTPSWPPSLSGNYLRRTHPNIAKSLDAETMKSITRTSIVTLREISKSTVRTISLLDVGPGQDRLVAPNAFSIAQASFHPEAWFRAIYADETPVGFAMLEDWSLVAGVTPELWRGEQYVALWRFMIDQRFQQLGFGGEALRLLIAHARTRPDAKNMLLSFVPEDKNPQPFYQRFGFVRTGDEDEGELVMCLALDTLPRQADVT